MNYTSRNGVTEQVRYFRQQPEHMKRAPFDFELDAHDKKRAKLDTAVCAVCVVAAVALYVWVFSK